MLDAASISALGKPKKPQQCAHPHKFRLNMPSCQALQMFVHDLHATELGGLMAPAGPRTRLRGSWAAAHLAGPVLPEEVTDHALLALHRREEVLLRLEVEVLAVPPRQPGLPPGGGLLQLGRPPLAQAVQALLVQVVQLAQPLVHPVLHLLGGVQHARLDRGLQHALHRGGGGGGGGATPARARPRPPAILLYTPPVGRAGPATAGVPGAPSRGCSRRWGAIREVGRRGAGARGGGGAGVAGLPGAAGREGRGRQVCGGPHKYTRVDRTSLVTLPVAWLLSGSLACMLGVQRLLRHCSPPLYVGLDSCL